MIARNGIFVPDLDRHRGLDFGGRDVGSVEFSLAVPKTLGLLWRPWLGASMNICELMGAHIAVW